MLEGKIAIHFLGDFFISGLGSLHSVPFGLFWKDGADHWLLRQAMDNA